MGRRRRRRRAIGIVGAGSSGAATTFTVTIGSGTVGSDLTDFPVMVRLSDMPASFWADPDLRSDGGNIRVKTTGGTVIPHDLTRFDPVSEDGVLFFLASSVLAASDNSWHITIEGSGAEKLAVDDANGRNAVWANYEAVFLLGETAGDDRTGGAMAEIYSDPDLFELVATSSTDLDSHQGVCWDGTYYYTIDDNAIYKWDASWNLVDSNTDPIGDASLTGTADHCGDPDVRGGRLYIPCEQYPTPAGTQHILVFDPSDLSFIEKWDISAQGHEAASIAYCDEDDLLYIVDYDGNNTSIFKYDPTDGSYEGTLTTDRAIPNRQGITWWRGFFWISQDLNDETLRVSYAGEVSTGNLSGGSGGVGFGQGTTGNYEGIGHTEEALLQLIDPGATERVETWKPRDLALAAGGGADFDASANHNIRATGRSSLSTFTIGVTAAVASKLANHAVLSYWDESAGGTNVRVTIAYDFPNEWGVWDSAGNGWLHTATDPTVDVPYRLHVVYDGTTARHMYVNGGGKVTEATISAAPATLDSILIGAEDETYAENLLGEVGFIYLYPGILSDDWIAAEYAMLNDPSSFYSVA